MVAPPNLQEPDLAELTYHGQLFDGTVELDAREANACHENAAHLYQEAKSKDTVGIGTGWALHDALWRQHSWFMREKTVVETTSKQDVYFGVLLTGARANQFLKQNL